MKKIKKFFHKIHNKKLIKKYPFIESAYSRHHKKDYGYTVLDMLPSGWRKAFGKQFCEDILLQCQKTGVDPKQVEFDDVKEKWGVLTISYQVPADSGVEDIIEYYEDLSMVFCIHCGKITKYETNGWINYICEDCAKKMKQSCSPITRKHIPLRSALTSNGYQNTKSKVPFEKYWKFDKDGNVI